MTNWAGPDWANLCWRECATSFVPTAYPVETRSQQLRTPAYCRPALEHGANGGGVRFREAERHGRVVNGCRRSEQWRRAVEFARELRNDLHILLPDADLHRRVGIVIANHHRPANLQHAGRASTIAQYL